MNKNSLSINSKCQKKHTQSHTSGSTISYNYLVKCSHSSFIQNDDLPTTRHVSEDEVSEDEVSEVAAS